MATSWEGLNALAWRNFGKSLNAAARQASGLDKDINGISMELYGKSVYGSMPELTRLLGGSALILPGVNGAFISTPDHISLDIIADIDMRAEILEAGVTGLNRDILSKYLPAANQSFEWRYNAFGSDEIVWSTTGANALTGTSSIAAPTITRFTMDVVSGTDRVLTWWHAAHGTNGEPPTIDDGPWVVRQQKTVAGNTSIFSGTAPLRIGARGDATGANPFLGRIARVQLRDGIGGTIVANPDFRFLAPGTTSFNDSTGKTWTIAGTATIG